jgi:hypothetical protein
MIARMDTGRGSMCLVCRTALAPGERCATGPKHRVARLDVPDERRQAVDTVWGPAELRGRKLAKVGGAGAGAGGLFDSCSGCSGVGDLGELGAVIVALVVAFIVAIAVWWIVTRIVHAVRARRARLRPRGAPRLPAPRLRLRGKLAAATGEVLATSGAACAAWGLRLRHDDALDSDVMLRDGDCAGLEIVLDDGRRVEIPAGRVRLDGAGDQIELAPAQLQRLDPRHAPDERFSPIAWQRADEVVLAIGDAVEVLGALETRPDPRGLPGGYRDAGPTLLVPAGAVWLARI